MDAISQSSEKPLAPVRTRIGLTFTQNVRVARKLETLVCEIVRRLPIEPQGSPVSQTSTCFDFADLSSRELLIEKMRERTPSRSEAFWIRVAKAMADIMELSKPTPTEGELEGMTDAECESLLFELHFMYLRLQAAIAVSHYVRERLPEQGGR